METYSIKNLTFYYPDTKIPALDNINLEVNQGEFLCLCGPSGCGKSTLLRHLKKTMSPDGVTQGEILFEGKALNMLDLREQAVSVGFVGQDPDNQIVCDKVWHEIAFGLENLGYKSDEIRLKTAEIAAFFGIEEWFYKEVSSLSGGQKQLLNLASVMAMQPKVLILDEPTAQLDPIIASEFIQTVKRINRDLGTTVVICEHRLEDVLPISDRVAVMENGRIVICDNPYDVALALKDENSSMFMSMPTAMRIYSLTDDKENKPPVTVNEGRIWLKKYCEKNTFDENKIPEKHIADHKGEKAVIELKDVWFRYEKNEEDVLRNVAFKAYEGEIFAIVGGNGAGKTTTLSVVCGDNKPYRGKVLVYGEDINKISASKLFDGVLGVLSQNPRALFVKKTVKEDLTDVLKKKKLSEDEKKQMINSVCEKCEIGHLLNMHPYDLSGGEAQRCALAKVLLMNPKVLLLDEPTKGMDNCFKEKFAKILAHLKQESITIIMVTHDIEFCAEYADRCAMFFNGEIVSQNEPHEFFAGNSFYTTASNKIARDFSNKAVTVSDVAAALGAEYKKNDYNDNLPRQPKQKSEHKEKYNEIKERLKEDNVKQIEVKKSSLKTNVYSILLMLLLIPTTIFVGWYYLDDRKYYFISLLVLIETIIPFLLKFESRKPKTRELIVIAVLCAIAVAGRAAFYMLPQFKPILAVIIISGIAFGCETGFVVGALSMFVSNMFFQQGPWTPWQMFAAGLVGFVAGAVFGGREKLHKKHLMAVVGGLLTFVIYGGIMNPSAVFTYHANPTKELFIFYYLQGIPLDAINAIATIVFLYLISEPIMEDLNRIKTKYGLIV